ncbi:MAG: hypothetical protein ACI4EF_06025 [Coprococcus sp.]
MLEIILGQNVFVYIMVAMGFIGITSRFILNGYLKGLIKETEKMGSTRKKALVEIRKRYEDVASLNVEINDVDSFVGKYIEKIRMGKISVGAFNNFIKNIFIITAGTGILSGIYQYYVVGSGMETLKLLGVGGASCTLMLVAWNMWDCGSKKEVLRLSVQNYLSNSLANRLHKAEMKQAAASDMSRSRTESVEISAEKDMRDKKEGDRQEVTDEQVAACDMLFEKLLQGIISDA